MPCYSEGDHESRLPSDEFPRTILLFFHIVLQRFQPLCFASASSALTFFSKVTVKMGFAGLRIKHTHHRMTLTRRADPNSACATGGFYKSPSNGATVDSMQPLPIAWDPTCLATTTADIYLFSPNSSHARIHVWQEVPFSAASYNATIMPRWWNSTSSQSLQLAIVPAGYPPFMTTLPAGPVITATYTAPASGQPIPAAADTSQVDSGITQVNAGIAVTSNTLDPGKVAAAVLLPLLFVAFGIAAYLRFQRAKQQDKTKRFSEVLDKRMSTISADWKSISAAGANAAIRSSMASGGVRNSTAFTFSGVRPASAASISMVPGQAGVGSFGFNNNKPGSAGEMTQVRTGTGVGLRHPNASSISVNSAERVSRISFAADTRFSRTSTHTDARPSMDSSRRGVPSRAFHSAYVPPVPPMRPDVVSSYTTKEKDAELSPRQAAGPLTLTPEDIRARMHGGPNANSHSGTENGIDEVMPALSCQFTVLSSISCIYSRVISNAHRFSQRIQVWFSSRAHF
jgi:hypothetical protein